VEADPNPHAGLRVVGLLGRHQIVEFPVQVGHRQHRQHSGDRLVLSGLPSHATPSPGVLPKKKPAVIRICAAAYAHQIGTPSASLPRTKRSIPIIASDTKKHSAPTAVQAVGSRASSAVHTIAHSTAM